jgi:ribosome-associated protein YbcJ (S4-like RNA binding protein)
VLIQSGHVVVNGNRELRRGRTVRDGDVVAVDGEEYRACTSPR